MPRFLKLLWFLCAVAATLYSPDDLRAEETSDFSLEDGDTIAFLGDSITAAGGYPKVVEHYTLLRFPDREIRFVNAGKGGDTAQTALTRLERDVFDRGATVVTVALGVNDIGWGMRADEEHRKLYLDGIEKIVRKCKEKGIRVFVCSAAVTGADPDKSENDFLQKMCDEGMALSNRLGENSIDVQRTMRQIQKKIKEANSQTTDPKAKTSLHAEDTIHLNDLGQLAMGYAILKGLGAPAEVSSATVQLTGAFVTADRCQVDNVQMSNDAESSSVLEFDRMDSGLPITLGLTGHLSYRFVPVPNQLALYMLAVEGLHPGKYNVIADGRKVGTYSAQQLAAGVNLGNATPDPWEPGGPWDAQSTLLRNLVDGRANMMRARFEALYYMDDAARRPALREIDQTNVRYEQMERAIAKPRKYHFEIQRAN